MNTINKIQPNLIKQQERQPMPNDFEQAFYPARMSIPPDVQRLRSVVHCHTGIDFDWKESDIHSTIQAEEEEAAGGVPQMQSKDYLLYRFYNCDSGVRAKAFSSANQQLWTPNWQSFIYL